MSEEPGPNRLSHVRLSAHRELSVIRSGCGLRPGPGRVRAPLKAKRAQAQGRPEGLGIAGKVISARGQGGLARFSIKPPALGRLPTHDEGLGFPAATALAPAAAATSSEPKSRAAVRRLTGHVGRAHSSG